MKFARCFLTNFEQSERGKSAGARCLGVFLEWRIPKMLNKNGSEHDPYINSAKLKLREEQLDISKKLIKTAEVTMHKEVMTEERNITVPITREEIVIKKRVIDNDDPSNKGEPIEVIRIPISTERVEIIKHQVILEDVEVYRHQLQEIQHIEVSLKKEKLDVKTHKEKG